MSPADQVLFDQWITRRDADAFTRLAEKYAAMVYAVGRRITGNTHDAEDVAQAAFEALASQRRAPRVHLGAWLHRVATYRALNHLKAERRRADREARYDRQRPKQTEIGWDDIYDLVDEAIAALPGKQRDVVVAHYLEGKTHDAIARELGISRPAVTQRVQAGVTGIRSALGKRGVAVPVALLGVLLVHGAEAATPVALAAQLGKIALSGYGGKTGAGIGLWQGMLEGMSTVKGLIGIALACGLASISIYPFVIGDAFGGRASIPILAPALDTRDHQGATAATQGNQSQSISDLDNATVDLDGTVHLFAIPVPSRPSRELTGIVVDESGRPFPDARISYSIFGPNGDLFENQSQSSDASGQFKLDLGETRPVFLFVYPPTYKSYMVALDPEKAAHVLESGEKPAEVKLILARQDYAEIAGTVRDWRGQPIADAGVSAVVREAGISEDTTPLARQIYSIRSDAQGQYKIPFVRRGERYYVTVNNPYFRFQTIKDVLPGSRDVDFSLKKLGDAEGQVVDAVTGKPIPEFTFSSAFNMKNAIDSPKSVTIRDAQGRFHFEEVAGESCSLQLAAPGYAPEAIEHLLRSLEEDVQRVTLKLVPLYSISGWVRDVQGQPIKWAGVVPGKHPGPALDLENKSFSTDADGWFHIEYVQGDSPFLTVGHPDFATQTVDINWSQAQAIEVVLKPGGALEGRVTLESRPAPGIEVVSTDGTTMETRKAITDSSGSYRISGIAPGTVTVAFHESKSNGGASSQQAVEAMIQKESTTTLNFNIERVPESFGSLEGTVFSEGEGLPYVKLEISLRRSGGLAKIGTRSDASGHFRFERVPAGRADLSVYHEHERIKRLFLDVPEGSAIVQDVVLESGASVMCTFENLPPEFSRIVVALFSDEDGSQDTALWDDLAGAQKVESADGQPVTLNGVTPGSYTIDAFIVPGTVDTENSETPLRDRQADWPQVRVPVVVGEEPELAVTLAF